MSKYSSTFSLTKKQCTWGWIWWALQLFLIPMLLREGNRFLAAPLSETRLNFVFFCINFIGIILILWRHIIASCAHGFRKIFRTLVSAFIGLAVYYLAKLLLNFATEHFFPAYANLNDGVIYGLMQDDPLFMRIGIFFLVPVAEELIYRGVIFGSIHGKSRFLAYALSAALFSLVHFIGYFPDPLTFVLSFVLYLPAGLSLAWAYERSSSVLAPILMHIAINLISTYFMR